LTAISLRAWLADPPDELKNKIISWFNSQKSGLGNS
jgi:hypothetical protein